MLCGVGFAKFVDEQERIANDPKRAHKELMHLHRKLHITQSKLKTLRIQTDQADRQRRIQTGLADRQRVELEIERAQQWERFVRCGHDPKMAKCEHDLKMATEKIEGLEKLRVVTEKKLYVMELERSRETTRARCLQRQLNQFDIYAIRTNPTLAALQKLTRSPAMAKHIAAACHPDECPSELSEAASELFRFVQSIREDNEE
jgi:hypothetical protein